jgi:hypothetical protein
MKKISILCFILFLVGIASTITAKSSCEVGYSQFTVPISVGGCYYHITLCYKCETTTQLMILKIDSYHKISSTCIPKYSDGTPMPEYDILNKIEKSILSSSVLLLLCPATVIKPCIEVPHMNFQFEHNICWYKKRDIDFPGVIFYEHCDYPYCIETYKWCWVPDYGDDPVLISSVLHGNFNDCQYLDTELDGLPVEGDYTPTPCFHYPPPFCKVP